MIQMMNNLAREKHDVETEEESLRERARERIQQDAEERPADYLEETIVPAGGE